MLHNRNACMQNSKTMYILCLFSKTMYIYIYIMFISDSYIMNHSVFIEIYFFIANIDSTGNFYFCE